MPRLTKSVPKYRKHRASGQAVVSLNGVDHYLGPHGTKASRLEYDRLIVEWLEGGRQLDSVSSEPTLTVTELATRFWKFAQRRNSALKWLALLALLHQKISISPMSLPTILG